MPRTVSSVTKFTQSILIPFFELLRKYPSHGGAILAGGLTSGLSVLIVALRATDPMIHLIVDANEYHLSSMLASAKAVESGLDSRGDGSYDSFSLGVAADGTYFEYPLKYLAWSAPLGNGKPDFFEVWLGRRQDDLQNIDSDPLFAYKQIFREQEGVAQIESIQVVLGDQFNADRHFVYHDLNLNGSLDVRRQVVNGETLERHIYLDAQWRKTLSIVWPHAEIAHNGGSIKAIFSDGQWQIRERFP